MGLKSQFLAGGDSSFCLCITMRITLRMRATLCRFFEIEKSSYELICRHSR